jgi:hypothetical protein
MANGPKDGGCDARIQGLAYLIECAQCHIWYAHFYFKTQFFICRGLFLSWDNRVFTCGISNCGC